MTDDLLEEEETKKKRQRVHFSRIRSIGAVFAGDNPEADILLVKEREGSGAVASAPAAKATGRGRSGSGRPLTVVETAAIVATIKARTAALTKNLGTETRMAGTNGETVRETVDRLAAEMVKSGEASSMTEARPAVWRSRPDLVAKSRTTDTPGRKRDPVPGGTAPEAGTLPERIAKAVDARAVEISAQSQHWTKTAAERRVVVWKSPDGQRLRELYTAAMKHRGKVSKSATSEHAAALEVLARWEDNPADGLR